MVIKNLGAEVVDSIFNERETNGLYKDLADFASRVHHRAFNKKSLEALIKSGALDRFGERKCLLENIEQILFFNKESKEKQAQNQSSLFDLTPALSTEKLKLRPTLPAEKIERLAWEKELLGLYISAHPYDDVVKEIGQYLLPLSQLQSQAENSFVKCGGLITSVKIIVTKKGDNMAFVGLDDKTGKAEVIVFPSAYNQFGKTLAEDKIVLVSAKVSRRDGEEAKLLANSFVFVDSAGANDVAAMLRDNLWVPGEATSPDTNQYPQPLRSLNAVEITFLGKPDPEVVAQLRELLASSRGSKRVRFIVDTGQARRIMDTDYYIDPTAELLAEIKALVGSKNVI